MHPNLIYWLWLTMAFGPCSVEKWNFLSHYDSVKSAYNAVQQGDLSKVMPAHRDKVKGTSLDQADKLYKYCQANGISICCYEDSEYPARIHDIYNAPSVLFYMGDISLIDSSVVITCVGTRNPSDYSVKICTRICKDLALCGAVIASGFQVGLDTLSHKSALMVGGKTIAVLPCGLLYDYPKGNMNGRKIIAQNGLVITELLPNDRPESHVFRARNRILSAVGLGTLVMQAGSKSGALSTASFALEQGKDIFCISPHELYNDAYAGVVKLIRDGAIPVFDVKDILNEYYETYSHKLNLDHLANPAKSESGIFAATDERLAEKVKPPKKQSIFQKKKPAPTPEPVDDNPFALTPEQQKVVDYLKKSGPVHMDIIIESLADITDDIESLVTDMELDGIIRSVPGNRFSI